MHTVREAVEIFELWAKSVPIKVQTTLTAAAEFVKKEVESDSFIGHSQPEWEPLKETTEDLKKRLGYSAEQPLLREGAMKASFRMKVMPYEAVVYSQDKALWYHESGTKFMPQRGVLSVILYRHEMELRGLLGTRFFVGMFKSRAML